MTPTFGVDSFAAERWETVFHAAGDRGTCISFVFWKNGLPGRVELTEPNIWRMRNGEMPG